MEEVGAVALHIFPEEAQREGAFFVLVADFAECLGRLEEHCDTLVFAVAAGRGPVAQHFLPGAGVFPFAGVGYMEAFAVAAHSVEHHEVVLVPVEYAGERGFWHVVGRDACGHCVKPHLFGGIGQGHQRDTLACGETAFFEPLCTAFQSMVTAHHGQRSHSAVHRVKLSDQSESTHIRVSYINRDPPVSGFHTLIILRHNCIAP